MKYELTKSFRKDFEKLKNKELASLILVVIESVSLAKGPNQIPNLKKPTGHKQAYRIRIGKFRIGLFIVGSAVIFATVDHRKNIYKRFP